MKCSKFFLFSILFAGITYLGDLKPAMDFDLAKELEQLQKTAAIPAKDKPLSALPQKATPRQKLTRDEKAFLDFFAEVESISKTLTKIVKGKKFTDAIEAKKKQHEQEMKKAAGSKGKDYSHRPSSSSSPWSKPMPYERPYGGRRGSGYGQSSRDDFGGGYKSPTDSAFPEPSKPTSTTSPTSLDTNKNKDDDDEDKGPTFGTHAPTKDEKDANKRAKALENRASSLIKKVNDFVAEFSGLKPDDLEKKYTEAAKYPWTKINEIKKELEKIGEEVDALGEFKKLFNESTVKTQLTSALSSYVPHALEIASRLDTPATKTPKQEPPSEILNGMLEAIKTFGISQTVMNAKIKEMMAQLEKDPALATITKPDPKAPKTTITLAKPEEIVAEHFSNLLQSSDTTKCQALRGAILKLANLMAVDPELGGTEKDKKAKFALFFKTYNDKLKENLELAKRYAGHDADAEWVYDAKATALTVVHEALFTKLGLTKETPFDPAKTPPVEKQKVIDRLKVLNPLLEKLQLPETVTEAP